MMKKFLIFSAILCLILLLGFIDYITGWELGFFVFYFIPITLAAWFLDKKYAFIIAVFSMIVWFLADFLLQQHYSSPAYLFWNSFIRLMSFLAVAYMVSKIKDLYNNEKKISHELQQSLDEIKVLKGILPICASCKKIRNDAGYWEQIEAYISSHTDAAFSHGICEDCAKKLYPDFYKEKE